VPEAAIDACVRDVARLADEALGRGPCDEDAFVRLMAAVEARVQAAVPAVRPSGEPPPACTLGCATCCTVNVATLPLEGAAAAAFLRRRTRPEAIGGRAAELLRFHDQVRWQDDGERIRARVRCPLLDARGGCSIHPARPLACRALSSLDADECRLALDERGEGNGPGLVSMNLLQKALYDGALGALSEVLARRGLDARRRDVSGMIGVFLADPARAAAFAAGAKVPIE
jgi:Putative zinc- or iron-chelating domain